MRSLIATVSLLFGLTTQLLVLAPRNSRAHAYDRASKTSSWSDPNSELYNVYLSDPIALVTQELSVADVTRLRLNNTRQIFHSASGLRVSVDAGGLSSTNPLVPFASTVGGGGRIRSGTSLRATTYDASRVLGPNPRPVGVSQRAPGTEGMVEVHNGEVARDDADLSLPSPRLSLAFTRHYRGQDRIDGAFGPGWDFNFNRRAIRLAPEHFLAGSPMPLVIRGGGKDSTGFGEDVIIENGMGDKILFKRATTTPPTEVASDPLIAQLGWRDTAIDWYLPPAGVFSVVARFPSGQLAELTPDGTQYWYDPNGYADSPNLYAGMGNDPINQRDPTGRRAIVPRVRTTPGGPTAKRFAAWFRESADSHRPGLNPLNLIAQATLRSFADELDPQQEFKDPPSAVDFAMLSGPIAPAGIVVKAGAIEAVPLARSIGTAVDQTAPLWRRMLSTVLKEDAEGVAASQAAKAASNIADVLRPGGRLIGEAGTSSQIRILQGGQAEAEALFSQLSKGGQVIEGTSYPGKLVRLPSGGQVGYRPTSTSGPPTIDVVLKGLGIREIKFIP